MLNNTFELEVGYSFIPKYWGKGFATEAANHMRVFGQENNMAKRIISIIHADNKDSMKVARKNAMAPLFEYSYLGMPVIVFGTTE